jgi:hypothetical protein
MVPWINLLTIVFLVLAVLLVIVDYFRARGLRRFVSHLAILSALVAAFMLTSSFPYPGSRQAFGGATPLFAVALMFVGVLTGIAATYVFNLAGAFSWGNFARPFVVSPLVLLPLIGSLQGATLEPIQLVCFTILAFQNGFFWQQVLRDARPTTV